MRIDEPVRRGAPHPELSARKTRLLLWSSLCFVGLALNNSLLVADLLVVPDLDRSAVRASVAAVAVALLLIGFIWESR